MNKNRLFELDDKIFEELVECQVKEQDFRKKTMKKVRKKNNTKLFEQLMEEDLKKKGYIK